MDPLIVIGIAIAGVVSLFKDDNSSNDDNGDYNHGTHSNENDHDGYYFPK